MLMANDIMAYNESQANMEKLSSTQCNVVG